MEMDREKARDKIQKLLRKAHDSAATPAEMASILAVVEKMMVQHHIEEVEFQEKEPGSVAAEPIGESLLDGKIRGWHRSLLSVLCNHFRCSYYMTGDTVYLVGRTFDRETVAYMFADLRRWMEQKAESELEDALFMGAALDPTESLQKDKLRFKIDFAKGAILMLHERLAQSRIEIVKELSAKNSTALAKVEAQTAEVKKWMQDQHPDLVMTKRQSSGIRDLDAARLGRSAMATRNIAGGGAPLGIGAKRLGTSRK